MNSNACSYVERLTDLLLMDPCIDEVGWISLDEDGDVFTLESHKLGIAFQIAAPLFRQARKRFHPAYSEFKIIDDKACRTSSLPLLQKDLNEVTLVILLLSADFYTAWNARRHLVIQEFNQMEREITFSSLVLTLHPKSIDTWAYRRWIADRIFKQLQSTELKNFLERELQLCEQIADRSARNYHAWSYRHMLATKLSAIDDANTMNKSADRLLQMEIERMSKWCRTHLTDYSAWNHRALLIRTKTTSEHDTLTFRLSECQFLTQIMTMHSTHEALWNYRRFISLQLYLHLGSQEPCQARYYKSLLRVALQKLSERFKQPFTLSIASEFTDAQNFVSNEIELAWKYANDTTYDSHPAWRYILWLLFICNRKVKFDTETASSMQYIWKQVCLRGSIEFNLYLLKKASHCEGI